MYLRVVAVSLIVAFLGAPLVRAQDRADLWRTYASGLPAHSLVTVQLKNGKRMQGHLVRVTDDRVVILRKTRVPVPPSEFALADVESIEPRKEGMSPGAKVLIGVGVYLGMSALLALALRGT